MWKWFTKFLGTSNRVLSIAKFDKNKSSILIVPPGFGLAGLLIELGESLKHHNVFILNELSESPKAWDEVLKKLGKQNFLAVAVYGKTASIAFEIVHELEKREYKTKLILIDGAFDTEIEFSSDQEIVSKNHHIITYLKSLGSNNSWLNSKNALEINAIKINQLALSKINSSTIQKIRSDIYIFNAVGGLHPIEQNLSHYTHGEIYPFPVLGHHYELLKSYMIQDLSFFISNILKGRQNLLIMTLTTQSAAPNWLKDQENRPMGEGKAPEICKKDVPFEMKQCPYSGMRKKHEKPMNVSALKQMRSSWDESLNLIRCIRDLYFQQHPMKTDTPTLLDVWKITLYASYLPVWMIYRTKKRVFNHGIPAQVAAVYKMFIGLKAPVEKMIKDQILGISTFDNLSSQVIHDYAESTNAFIGPEEVCGGPENLITEFLEAIMDVSKPGISDDNYPEIMGNEKDYFTFIHAIINLKLIQQVRLQQTQFLVKTYLNHTLDQELVEDLKKAFYISEGALEIDQHLPIIENLKTWMEQKENFEIRLLDDQILRNEKQVLEIDHQINQDFFQQVKLVEQQLLEALGMKHNIIVDNSVFVQYMGELALSDFLAARKK